jgi:hypothetical protein
MKSTITAGIFAITFLFLSLKTQAQELQWPSVTISSLVASKYLGFGTGNLLSKDPVAQTDLFIIFKNGFYADLWHSRSLKGSWNDGSLGNEIDYGVGWKGKITRNLTLNIGVSYSDDAKVFTLAGGDMFYTHASLTRDFEYISMSVGYENFTTMPNSGFRGGNLISLTASKYKLLFNNKIGLRASVVGEYDTGTLGSSHGFVLRGSAGTDWNMMKHVTFNVLAVNWYIPVTPHDKRVADAVFYSGLTFRF